METDKLETETVSSLPKENDTQAEITVDNQTEEQTQPKDEIKIEDTHKVEETETKQESEVEGRKEEEVRTSKSTEAIYAVASFSTSDSTTTGKRKIKIPLLTTGYWFHPEYGDIKVTPDYIKTAKNNYDSNALGFTPYITYGHIKDIDTAYSKVQTTDAELNKGDIQETVIEDNTLFGICEVSYDTSSLVEKGELKFNSPEIIPNFRSKKDGSYLGPVIHRTALTSSPYLAPMVRTQVLSQSSEDSTCLPNPIPLVIRLTSNIDNTINSNMQTNSPSIEEGKEQAVVVTAVETVAPVIVSEPEKKVSEVVHQPLDVASIIKAAIEPLTSTWELQAQAMKSSYEKAIEELKGKVSTLETDLQSQRHVSHAFSQRISLEERAAKNSYLAAKGFSPVLIDGYNAIADSISSASSVVKFSQTGKDGKVEDAEVSVLTALENLILNAAATGMVDKQRYGQSHTSSSSLDSELRELARKNIELANKTNK